MKFCASHRVVAVSMLFLFGTACHSGTITREFSNTYDFEGHSVAVKTNNGSIFVETWDANQVHVDAEIQVRSGSKETARDFMDKVQVVVRQREDQLLITVDQPVSRGSSFLDWIFGAAKPSVTVDFEIKVPERMNVSAYSVNGSLETVGINGSAILATTNGKIAAEETSGSIKAETTNGSIKVDCVNLQGDEKMELYAVNGNIVATFARSIGADIKASTVNGAIRTDFPLEIKGEWGPKNVSGKMNGGGAQIHLETVNGSVSIEER